MPKTLKIQKKRNILGLFSQFKNHCFLIYLHFPYRPDSFWFKVVEIQVSKSNGDTIEGNKVWNMNTHSNIDGKPSSFQSHTIFPSLFNSRHTSVIAWEKCERDSINNWESEKHGQESSSFWMLSGWKGTTLWRKPQWILITEKKSAENSFFGG